MFRWHNESLNIWTHWLGVIFFLALVVRLLTRAPRLLTRPPVSTRANPTQCADLRLRVLHVPNPDPLALAFCRSYFKPVA